MKLSEFKNHLSQITEVKIMLPNGQFVPPHFHVTELGLITKSFVDCGGAIREDKSINFQLWVSNDIDHKLDPTKLLGIIKKGQNIFTLDDLEIEFEFQQITIEKYGLEFNNQHFVLTPKFTDCLAKDNCGVTYDESESTSKTPQIVCKPGTGCC